MSAEIIPFPRSRRPSCFDCEHASVGAVTYCTEFREEILLESEAEDCSEFELLPEIGAGDGRP